MKKYVLLIAIAGLLSACGSTKFGSNDAYTERAAAVQARQDRIAEELLVYCHRSDQGLR
mgnify:CR=1 FL=1